MSKTEKLYRQTVDEAMRHVEELVRQAFREDSRLTDCVLAMGSYTFYAKRHGIIDDTDVKKYPATKPVFDFIQEWDDYLKISGAGVWFKRDGSTLTDW